MAAIPATRFRIGPLAWLTLALLWLTLVFGSPTFGLAIVSAVPLLVGRRFAALVVVAALCPFTFFMAAGVADYVRGRATIQGHGLPLTIAANLDRELRIPHMPGGCMVNGGEWVMDWPYQVAVAFLIRHVDPMPGSYVGPYPSEVEALAAVTSGQAFELPLVSLANDRVCVLGKTYTLASGAGLLCVGPTDHRDAISGSKPPYAVDTKRLAEMKLGPAMGAVLQKTCLVVRISRGAVPQDGKTPASDAQSFISLVDLGTGRCFAHYAPRGSGMRFPITSWTMNPPVTARAAAAMGGLVVFVVSTALALSSAIAARIRAVCLRRRQSDGHCVVCGYDLRASPGRCPECGFPEAQAPTAITIPNQ